MDFELTEEQELFRKTVHDWVEREAPKRVARELETDEHEFPHALFDKFTEAGFHGDRHRRGVRRSGRRRHHPDDPGPRLARSLAGLTWVWGITSFAGGKSVGLYGTEEQKQRHLPAIAEGARSGRSASPNRRRHRPARRACDHGHEGRRRLARSTARRPGSMAHVADYLLLLARTDDDGREAPPGRHAVPRPPTRARA